MNPFLTYVQGITQNIQQAESLVVDGAKEVVSSEHKGLIFAPHPDDECITGLLPLRLQRELHYQIVNVPMTFGSLKSRRAGRLGELTKACSYLGWHNHLQRDDLENLTTEDVVRVLEHYKPRLIVFPHGNDWNSRHVEVHHLLMQALRVMDESFRCIVVECEFWNTMETPNCMVEASEEDLATLIAATSLHTEEVARNPYHLTLPAWMIDNVRRGAEIIGGQGGESPDFIYSTLYRIQEWNGEQLSPLPHHQATIPQGEESLHQFKIWK